MAVEEKVVDGEIDYAYKVVGALTAGAKAVLAEPSLKQQFIYEMILSAPKWLDSIMVLVKEEHRGVMLELVRAVVTCLKSQPGTK